MYAVSSFAGPINGPCYLPDATNPVQHVLICLHGFGSSGDDLLALAPVLKLSLGNLGASLAIYTPHGPALTPGGNGYQWFRDMGWTFRDPDGLKKLTPDLDGFIESIARKHQISSSQISLLGFSQGAMTILHTLPLLNNVPGAVISCCGAISVPPIFSPESKPIPLLFIHGQDDDVLPADTSVQAANTYTEKGYPTQIEIIPNLGHGIDTATLAHISVFLSNLWATS